MNSIDRVRAAIHFSKPDRVPIYKAGLGDVFPMAMLPPKSWQPGHSAQEKGLFPYLGDSIISKLHLWKWIKPAWAKIPLYRHWNQLHREEVDEWGVIWNQEPGYKTLGHPGRAVILEWSQLNTYFDQYHPDPTDRTRYALFLKLRKIFGAHRYRMGSFAITGPFQLTMNLRGFHNFITDHRRHPAELKAFLARLVEFYITNEKMWVKYGGEPHGFLLYDDLGTQDRPFLTPSMFKEFYEPVYRPLIDTAHDLKCEFHLHSCGKVDPYLPHLIDWGLDAVEFDSPRMCGYSDLKPFRGKLMFWGCVNIQSIYVNGTPADCQREVWHMMRNLGTEIGGFGAYFYPTPYQIRTPPKNVEAFQLGLKKYGTYANIPPHWWIAPMYDQWDDNIVPKLPEF
jgi:uroporphyrinogen decarboxylase